MICDCELADRGDPLCGFCEDDLFCPQCGEEVFELSSENEPPEDQTDPNDRRRLWVYALFPEEQTDSLAIQAHECRVYFKFATKDRNRNPVQRKLSLDLAACNVDAPYPFARQLELVSEQYQGSVYRLTVLPVVLEKFGPDWYTLVPDQGVPATLTLVGNCGCARSI